jgi:hypothetical protein
VVLTEKLPIVAVQSVVHRRDLPVATVFVTFSQQLGGTLFLAIGQAVFQSGLVGGIRAIDPSISPSAIIAPGATGLQQIVPPGLYSAVLSVFT